MATWICLSSHMNCPSCNSVLNNSDRIGNYCWCPTCRTNVPAKIPKTEWQKKLKAIYGDPTLASLQDVERMAVELMECQRSQK
jgi:hypothetical protein